MLKNLINLSAISILAIAFNACSNQTLSETPKIENLAKVQNIKSLQGMNEVGLEWDPIYNQDVEGYRIYRKDLSVDEPSEAILIATIKDRYATHFSDNKLKPNTEYSYTVVTYNKDGNSDEVNLRVKTQPKIESIPFIQAITGLPNKIKIIWRPHSDTRVVKYNLYKQNANSDNWYRLATINNRLSAEYIDNVKPNNYAKYKVSAVSFDGVESDFSDEVEAISKILPPQIVNMSVTTNLPKKIILSWDAPHYEDFSHYTVYASNAALLPFYKLATTKETRYEDNVENDGVSRYYYVTMIDKDGLESPKSSVNVVGMSLEKPKTPVLTGFELIDENTLRIKWVSADDRTKTFKLVKNNQEVANHITGDFYIDTTYADGDIYQIIGIDEFGIESKISSKLSVK